MPNMQEITDTIDRRIVELRGEIDSLEAARRALTEIRTVRPNGADPRGLGARLTSH